MKDIVFHIPRGLREYSIVQQAVIGRMVVLSHKGANTVLYSTEDAKRDGFTQTFNNALLALKNFLQIKKGFRSCRQITVSQVLQMDSCIYINVPVSVMQREDLNFAEKMVFGRIYTQTKQGTEKIKLTTYQEGSWLKILEKNNKTRYIVGYKFSLNNQGISNIMDDKGLFWDMLRYKNIPVIEQYIIFHDYNPK